MIKKIIFFTVINLLFFACQNHKPIGNLLVKGTVKGLRLGTLQLKRLENDSLITLDSIMVDGNEKFEFHTNIDEPQIMALELPEVKDGRILFFATPGDTIRIFTYIETFGLSPVVKGGVNQSEKNAYDKMIKQFNNKELDLFKARFEATKNHLIKEADSLKTKLENLQRKRKLYALNFIFRNKDKAIAPYIALSEFYDNPKALDTIYKMMPDEIKQSIYGKKIKKILDKN